VAGWAAVMGRLAGLVENQGVGFGVQGLRDEGALVDFRISSLAHVS
jgi:hypothetical protein